MSSDAPSALSSCYDDLPFEKHEWGKHGVCAGVKDANDFFTQVCALSAAPLKVMTATVSGGSATRSKCPPPWPQLAPCAPSARDWLLWAAWYSQSAAQPRGAPPPPRGLKRAASKSPMSLPLDYVGGDVARAAADLAAAGYAIFGTDATNAQVELSVCNRM